MTCDYLKAHFSGSAYLEGSGTYDHSIASAMWTLEGNQELLDTYRQALKDHDLEDKALAPALRLTTSDVDKGATLQNFRKNLDKIFSRYQEAMNGISSLMDIEIENPVNCLHLVMKEIKISQKIRNEVVEQYVAQYGEDPCTAHDLYYAINEASFFAACEGFSGSRILKLEEDIARTLSMDWKAFDVIGAIKL